jgi:PadR family transcriptional regulator PadR
MKKDSIDLAVQRLKGNAAMLVLALLKEKSRHGYELRQVLLERSHHAVRLSFGTLYPLLETLEKSGLIRSRSVPAGKIRKLKQYSLTANGRQSLELQRHQWTDFVATVDSVLSKS